MPPTVKWWVLVGNLVLTTRYLISHSKAFSGVSRNHVCVKSMLETYLTYRSSQTNRLSLRTCTVQDEFEQRLRDRLAVAAEIPVA